MSIKRLLYKPAAPFIALVIVLSSLLPFQNFGVAYAYSPVSSRSIEMNNSTASATNVTYQIGYTTTTSATIKGIVIDFCDISPIIGDTCAIPSGFSVGTPTVTTSGGVNTGLSGSWTAASANSGRTLTLTNGSGTTFSSPTSVIFTLSTATNPSAVNTSFYARILTFPNTADVTTYTSDSTGQTTTNVIDAGGIALSTAANITVTSKVQEQLTFCVYTGLTCGAGGASVTLGDNHGVLSTAGPFVDITTKYDVSTNASSGVAIRLKGDTLKSGSFSIASIGNTATASSPGVSQFGLCTYQSTGSGLSPAAPYNNGSCSAATQTAGTGTPGGDGGASYALNTPNTTSTFGDIIANKTAGSVSQGKIPFIGNIAVTQQAGIYTTVLIFIATGTY